MLRPFIRSFAIAENPAASSYKVLPDTGVVIGFQYKGKLSLISSDNETPLATSGITGLNNSFRIFKNSADIGTVLAFFKEGGAAAFFKQPIHELFRESVSLDNFILRSELIILEERLCEAATDQKRVAVIEQFLISKLSHITPDNLVLMALAIIHQTKGNIRISELANQLNISQSPLEKRFRNTVGSSPKKFASIVRFKHILYQQTLRKNSLQQDSYENRQLPSDNFASNLSFEAGFYDQSHFIKEFKNFTGETPEGYFK